MKKRPSRPLRNPNADTSSARPKKVATPENPKPPGQGRKKRSPPQRAKTRFPLSNPPAENLAPRGPGNDSTLTSRSKIKGEKAIFAKNFPASRNLCLKSGKTENFPIFPDFFPNFDPNFGKYRFFGKICVFGFFLGRPGTGNAVSEPRETRRKLRFWLIFEPAYYGGSRFRASRNPGFRQPG